jgi:hypothetical protein
MHMPDYSWVLYVIFSAVAAGIFVYLVGLLVWHKFYRTRPVSKSTGGVSAKNLDAQTDAIQAQ